MKDLIDFNNNNNNNADQSTKDKDISELEDEITKKIKKSIPKVQDDLLLFQTPIKVLNNFNVMRHMSSDIWFLLLYFCCCLQFTIEEES